MLNANLTLIIWQDYRIEIILLYCKTYESQNAGGKKESRLSSFHESQEFLLHSSFEMTRIRTNAENNWTELVIQQKF